METGQAMVGHPGYVSLSLSLSSLQGQQWHVANPGAVPTRPRTSSTCKHSRGGVVSDSLKKSQCLSGGQGRNEALDMDSSMCQGPGAPMELGVSEGKLSCLLLGCEGAELTLPQRNLGAKKESKTGWAEGMPDREHGSISVDCTETPGPFNQGVTSGFLRPCFDANHGQPFS